jgi:tetratricopeptide (TPR) repeat protein
MNESANSPINPKASEDFNLQGIELGQQGKMAQAAQYFQKAINLNPGNITAYSNLGVILAHYGQFDQARQCFAQAIALDPNNTTALTNDALILLLHCQFAEGWQKYEYRPCLKNGGELKNLWSGAPIPNQILLVIHEQGSGDTIQFIRYLPIIRKLCGKLIFLCPPPMKSLLNGFPGIDVLTDTVGTGIECHASIELIGLPRIVNTTAETIPADVPYLSASAEKAGFWKKTIVKNKLNVGLAWAGNPKNVVDWKRSLHLSDFAPLANPGIVFHSLQVAHRSEEAEHPPNGMRLENPAKDFADFSDTAGMIENLDLVIAVDTAVAHLTGAMGKPVWILLPFSPDWRWMLNREDSPWYPTARLFRQPQPENWAAVIQRVADELNRIVLQKASELRRQAAACLRENKQNDALVLAQAAISFKPDYADAHFIRGYVLQSSDNMTSAEESFRVVVSAKPELSEAHYGLGLALQAQGKPKEAMECYQRVLALNPKHVNTYNNLGNLFAHYKEIEKARECFARIRTIDPKDTLSLAYQALLLLLEGHFAEGWEKYEFRPSLYETSVRKKWDGSDMPDQTVMVLHEQGVGDTVQFVRYLPIVRERCKKLVFVCQSELISLLNGFPGIDVLTDDPLGIEYHAAIPLLSIPGVLKTTLETIPKNVPYLSANPEKAAFWKKTMAADKLNIGLVWAGNSKHLADWKRSLHLADFAPLAIPGVVFHSLQVGNRAEEAEQPPNGMRLENPAKNFNDFSDTAAIIENLDLVISVDTAVAHLSGAMGKPVWILLPFSPDWRWMLNREDSPWYPTARLFRQSQPDVWTEVIQRVADELKRLVSNRIFKRGFELHSQNNTKEAIEYYQNVIAVNPRHAIAHNNLGFIYLQNGQFDKAKEHFSHALEIDPNYASALFNQSLILLLEGNFSEGWQKYEYRPSMDKDLLPKKWDGSPLENKTLLAVYEQGMGDSIQFMRYLPIVRQLCEKLIFICHADLKPLINFPGIEVLANDQARTVQCDAVIQLLSIPAVLNTTIETIPADIPYITAIPEKAASRKKTMSADKLNVGLVWAGNPNHLADAKRSLHLSDFAPLAHPGVVFHSLQVAHRAEEAEHPPEGMKIENPAKVISDFSDTAAIIENFDLVISVDTAVAHLAGAMGKPVWILLPFSPDWRWMLNREDSPWYPTARLFRQSQPDVWTDVIQRVADELNHVVAHRAAGLYRASINLIRENKLNDALALTDKAISIKPDFPDAVFNQGYIFKLMGNHKASEESFRRFIELKPDHAEAYLGLGLALQEQGKPKEASEQYQRVLSLNPNHTEAHLALGNALKELGRIEESLESYQQTLRINPNHVEGWKGFGMALKEQGKMQQALTCYEKALSLDPKNIETWISIGNLKKAMGDLSGSIDTYRQTIQLKPDEGRVHSFLALALLLRGEFDEGWKEYEWRWEIEPLSVAKRHYSAPRWSGEPLNGKRIFLYGEQGFGDILQFVRYALVLKNMGARIFLECYQELLPLVSRMSIIDAVVVPNHQIPAFDYHCPLMSLPYIFKTRLESIPAPVPYLFASPEAVGCWQNRLKTDKFKVGIIWAGNPSHKKDRERSIPLCQLAPILKTPGVQFFSLQVGGRAKDIQESCAFGDIVDLSPELKDFDDTAAVMSALDLIISVDTASAHLAGALGRPVWIMLQFSPDFRWLWGREDSPWYPSARLFRQPEHNCWEAVIRQIASELTDLTPQSLA